MKELKLAQLKKIIKPSSVLLYMLVLGCAQNDSSEICDAQFLDLGFTPITRNQISNCKSFQKVSGIDMEMYEKVIEDTVIKLTFSGTGNDSLYLIQYLVALDKTDSSNIEEFLNGYQASIFTEFNKESFGVYDYGENVYLKGRVSKGYLELTFPIKNHPNSW